MMLMISCNYTYIEVITMAISYKKLWKLLIDRDMKKKDLQKLAGISSATVTNKSHTKKQVFMRAGTRTVDRAYFMC
jgi:hypothetical protein